MEIVRSSFFIKHFWLAMDEYSTMGIGDYGLSRAAALNHFPLDLKVVAREKIAVRYSRTKNSAVGAPASLEGAPSQNSYVRRR